MDLKGELINWVASLVPAFIIGFIVAILGLRPLVLPAVVISFLVIDKTREMKRKKVLKVK